MPSSVQKESLFTPSLDGLTGLRGWGALMVALFHFREALPNLYIGFLGTFVGRAHMLVDLFFVLSGYVIAYAYRRRAVTSWAGHRSFMWARFTRIYPLHLATLGIFIALELVKKVLFDGGGDGEALAFEGLNSISTIPANLLLLQATGATSELSWNLPSWSVSAEWFAYLLFPLIAGYLMKVGKIGAYLLYAVAVFGLTALSYTQGNLDVTHDFGALRGICGFGIGVITYRIVTLGGVPKWASFRWAGPAVIAVYYLSLLLTPSTIDGLIIPFLSLLVVVIPESSLFRGLFETKFFVVLGNASYSIYLLHILVVNTSKSLWDIFGPEIALRDLSTLSSWVVALVWYVVVIGISIPSFRYFERPVMNRLRRKAG